MRSYIQLFLILLPVILRLQERPLNPALARLIETERAFARTSVQKGIRDSFLEYFADDGIVFRPHPIAFKEWAKINPAPAQRPPVTLDWEPVVGDVSAGGDLGYDTGPFTLTDNSPQKRPAQHGYFFSVWKKQNDDNWKVVLDVGIQTPSPPLEPRTFRPPPVSPLKKPATVTAASGDSSTLVRVEKDFQREATSNGILPAYLKSLSNLARLHRNGLLPIVGKDSIRAYLGRKSFSQSWEILKTDIARSGDLGYTYGTYDVKEGNIKEKGYFVRVWKRSAENKWEIVLDTASPLPEERRKTE